MKKIINIPIYDCRLVVTDSHKVFCDLCEEYDENEIQHLYGCVSPTTDGEGYCMFLGDKSINTIAHECFHVASFVLGCAGVRFEMAGTNEAYAYLLGWLTEEVSKVVKKNVAG
jgi:hypothetical protein